MNTNRKGSYLSSYSAFSSINQSIQPDKQLYFSLIKAFSLTAPAHPYKSLTFHQAFNRSNVSAGSS